MILTHNELTKLINDGAIEGVKPEQYIGDDHGRRKSMTYYEAKFAREAKENPLDWLILPAGSGKVQLVRVRESS